MNETIMHFGVKLIKRKYFFNLVRDEFALVNTKSSFGCKLFDDEAYVDGTLEYKIEWCEKYRKLCLENFDYNMKIFNSLDEEEFQIALDN